MAQEFNLSKTAAEINEKLEKAVEIKIMTSAEYDLLPETNANNLYILTDVDEESMVFDETPISGSSNPVTSGGVYDALSTLQGEVDNKADYTDLESHVGDTSNPHGVTADQVGALPSTGGELTGILYTSASTPLLVGKNGKVGMRAATDDNINVGQINISNSWYTDGDQWGAQMSALNGKTGKRNGLRVSHNGLEYEDEDEVVHQVLHDGNVTTYLSDLQTEVDGKQDALTFDTTPTSGSSNPITSGGVYAAIEAAFANIARAEEASF